MAAPYVTGALILAHVRKTDTATADDEAWSDTCAAAVEEYIAWRLDGVTPSAGQEDAIRRAALQDGAAAYVERDAPHGILSMGPDGEAVRLGRDIARALIPVLTRVGTVGIG